MIQEIFVKTTRHDINAVQVEIEAIVPESVDVIVERASSAADFRLEANYDCERGLFDRIESIAFRRI